MLNRFCMQAVIGHPLTVYGSGTQTRGFLNIRDTLQCVELATEKPADARRVPRVQPVHRAVQRARTGRAGAGRRGRRTAPTSTIEHYANPRVEAEHHYYNAANRNLLELGLQPHLLGDELVQSMLSYIERHRDRVITRAIEPHMRWRPDDVAAPPQAAVSAGNGDAEPTITPTRRFARD